MIDHEPGDDMRRRTWRNTKKRIKMGDEAWFEGDF